MKTGFSPSRPRRQRSSILGLQLALLLCCQTAAPAAAPDLTAGGVPDNSRTTNLGPTGMRGWTYHVNSGGRRAETTESRQILITAVAAGSPAAGLLAVDDVILGASGTGAEPVNFTSDARKSIADTINDAEARSPATLKLIRWRAGTTSTVEITLQTLGVYSSTAPYNCPKSALILHQGLQAVMSGESAGRYSFGLLTLLAANDPSDPDNAARMTRARNEARALIPNATTRAQMMSDARDSSSMITWQRGHTLIALAEYFLVTGDPEVLPAIEAYAVNIAKNTSLFGTVGHIFAEKFSDGSANGPMGGVYGPVNSAGMPCFLGLLLARECGLSNPEIEPAIVRSSRFFASYSGRGSIPYGEHEPYPAHESNGKSGLAALCFALQNNRVEEGKFYAKMAAAAPSEREHGHTGAFFNYLWSPLGAAVGGEEAAALHFGRIRWMLDLNRRWDGKFDYDCLNGEGPNSGSSYNDFRMSTAALLVYALPLRQLHLTGRSHEPALSLSGTDLAEAAVADDYTAASRTVDQLISDSGSWSPKTRRQAAIELKARGVDTTRRNQLHAIANNPELAAHVRAGACDALGRIGHSSSATMLAALLTDPESYVRYAAGEALRYMPNADRLSQLTEILLAAASTSKPLYPLDEEDPLHFAHGRLAVLLFYSGNAYGPKGILYQSIVGVDRELLYPAMRAVAATPIGFSRSCLATIYPMLSEADMVAVAGAVVDSAVEFAPSDRMFSFGIRREGFNLLEKFEVAEGVPAGLKYLVQTSPGDRTAALRTLEKFAASYTTITPVPEVIETVTPYLDPNVGGSAAQKVSINEAAQAVLDAIANDTNPKTLVPFKGIVSVTPDAPQLTLPANSTILRVDSFDHADGDSIFTWRKILGPGAVIFSGNGTADGDQSAIEIDPIPGEYLFEVIMSDSRGLTEVSETVALTLFDTDGGLPDNLPPTAHPQWVTLKRGTTAPVTLDGTDPEGYELTYSILSQPANGTLGGTPPALFYTPSPGFAGDDGFTFQVMDSGGEVSAETAVSLIVLDESPAIALYEPFDYAIGNISGRNGGIGFGGAWSNTRNNPSIGTGSKSWGILPSAGNHVRGNAWSGLVRPVGSSLSGAGLMHNGATLWFSVVFDLEGQNFTNADLNLALGTNAFVNNDYGTRQNLTGGEGIGVTHSGGTIQGAYWKQNAGDLQAGRVVDDSSTVMTPVNFRALVVGKIDWGAGDADPETFTLYTPDESLSFGTPAMAAWTIPALDQSQFDSLALQFKDGPMIDEIRFGHTFDDVVNGVTATPPVAHPLSLTFAHDSPGPVTLTGEAPGGGPPVFAVTRQPLHGALSGSAPDFTYTPLPGFHGADRFTFSVTDAGGLVAEALIDLTVEPAPGDYDSWAAGWPGVDLADPNGDHDGDGMSNNAERVFGLDPTSGADARPIGIPLDASGTFSYQRRDPALTGMTFTVWTSPDLENWTEDVGAVQTPGPMVDAVETVAVTLSPSLMAGPFLFVQVRGTRN